MHKIRSKTSRNIFAQNSTKSFKLNNFLKTRQRRAKITTNKRI